MTWAGKVATLVVGAMLLTPLHIFLTGDNGSPNETAPGKAIVTEGKSAWELLKEIQANVDADRAAAQSKAPSTENNGNSAFRRPPDTGDQGADSYLMGGARARIRSYNPMNLVLSFWAIDDDEKDGDPADGGPSGTTKDDGRAGRTVGGSSSSVFGASRARQTSSDPLENGIMLAISGVLLFLMIAVLAFDIGGKAPWPTMVLSRSSMLAAEPYPNVEERGQQDRVDDVAVVRRRTIGDSGPVSHRVEEYLASRHSERSSGSRRISIGYDRPAANRSKQSRGAEAAGVRATSASASPTPRQHRSRNASNASTPIAARASRSESPSQRHWEDREHNNKRRVVPAVEAQSRGPPLPSPQRRADGRLRNDDMGRQALEQQEAVHPGTSGTYNAVDNRPGQPSASPGKGAHKDGPGRRPSCTYSSSQSDVHARPSAAVGDGILKGSQCSFAIQTNPDAPGAKAAVASASVRHGDAPGHQRQPQDNNKSVGNKRTAEPKTADATTSRGGRQSASRNPPFLNFVLQSLCQCPILKYFFVDGPSQVYFEEGERLASPLTQLFAKFLRDVWHSPGPKISTDVLQNVWTSNVNRMYNDSLELAPSLEHFLSTFFLALYTDIRAVAKHRSHYKALPEDVTRIGKLIGSSVLERRKIEVRVSDENGVEVPHELLAHSALTFPGVTFSSPTTSGGGKLRDSEADSGCPPPALSALLSSVCRSSSGNQLKIDNESMQIPCLLNFHYPGHYFTNFPEKLYIRRAAAEGKDAHGAGEAQPSASELFALYAVVFQLRGQEIYSVAIKHAVRGHWYYTEGSSVAKCKVSPSLVPPKTKAGTCPKPVLLLYAAEQWNEKLPSYGTPEALQADAKRQSANDNKVDNNVDRSHRASPSPPPRSPNRQRQQFRIPTDFRQQGVGEGTMA